MTPPPTSTPAARLSSAQDELDYLLSDPPDGPLDDHYAAHREAARQLREEIAYLERLLALAPSPTRP